MDMNLAGQVEMGIVPAYGFMQAERELAGADHTAPVMAAARR